MVNELFGPVATVTQITSVSTGVTINARHGQITTFAMDAAAGAENAFTVTNNTVRPSSVVLCSMASNAGTGIAMPAVSSVADGSFVLQITNIDAAAAFNAALVVNFLVLG